MKLRNVSEQIADWLAAQGLTNSFCVTGGGAMFLNQAFGNHPKIQTTYMHHEQACAMAAEGYSRVCAKPALTLVTTGPGSINAMNGVFGAFTDSVPMLILSGQAKSETCKDFYELPSLRQLGDQEAPTIDLVSPICKYAKLIRSVDDLSTELPLAYATMLRGRPGPVWLDIPLDIQSSIQQINFVDDSKSNPNIDNAKLFDQCEHILNLLKASQRPVILAGTGIRISNQIESLLKFAHGFSLPICTAWTHDLIESDHPLFAGRPGTIGTRAGNFCLQAADLVIVLGSRLNIRQTSYNFESFARHAHVVHVDVDPAELNKPTYAARTKLHADLAQLMPILLESATKAKVEKFDKWLTRCQKIGEICQAHVEHAQDVEGILNPYIAIKRIFDRLPEETVVVSGNASACIIPFQVGKIKRGTRLFSNSGSASMGYDVPAAIGASIASKKTQKVVCFAGDGSIQMNIQELQTIKTLQPNILIIVINNSGYLSIWQTHQNFFGKIIGATPKTGVEFPNFASVANAYGIRSIQISSLRELEAALETSLSLTEPMLIDMIVDPQQVFSPRIKSRVDEGGKFVTPELDDMFPFLTAESTQEIRSYLIGSQDKTPSSLV